MRLSLSPSLPLSFITISEYNKKMGAIPSFSTPAVKSCPRGLPCYAGCYAKAYEEKRDTVHKSYVNNMEMLKQHPKEVEDRIVGFINLLGCKYFRFSVSGDVIVDVERPYLYIDTIINIARRCKNTYFLCFSKSSLWNYVDIPSNLNVVYSSWGDWHVDNPHNFPTTNVCKKPKKGEEPPEGLEICPNSKDKNKHCFGCWKCWDLKPGDKPIYFYAHGVNANKIDVKPPKKYYRDAKGRFCKKPTNISFATAVQAVTKLIKITAWG